MTVWWLGGEGTGSREKNWNAMAVIQWGDDGDLARMVAVEVVRNS